MSQLLTRTARLLPYAKRAKALPSFATAYNYEPEPGEPLELGNLFVVIEVLTAAKQAEEVADLIIKTVGEAYYNLPFEETDETPSTDDEEDDSKSEDKEEAPAKAKLEPKLIDSYVRFERAVRAVNHQLSDYTNQGNAGWVGRLSAVVAVQVGEQLHITQTGSASGYLFRHTTASHMTEDITSRGPHRPASTFVSISTGQLEAQDHLLLATPALFHQISKDHLQTFISDSSPQVAVSKMSELINDTPNADRVAALVIEVTTADQLAQQRGADSIDEPQTVNVGTPESALAGVKEAAGPAMAKGLTGAKKLGRQAMHQATTNLLPKVREFSVKGFTSARAVAKNPRHRSKLYVAGGLLVLVIGWLVYANVNTGSLDKLVKRYNNDFTQVQTAHELLAAGNKTGARQALQTAAQDLNNLGSLPQSKLLEARLQKRAHPEDDPASISQLKAQIAALIDQIDGLVTVAPQDLADFDSIKNAKIGFMDIAGGKIFLTDSSNGAVYVYDQASNQLLTGVASPGGVGKVVATTASSAGDGIYLLTEEPAVWFFKADGNQLTKQTVSPGNWEKGSAIASYNGNVYILASDSSQIYRHIKTVGGFGPGGNYLTGDGGALLANSKGLMVDGLVYTFGPNGLKRFNSGKLDKGLSLPDPLVNLASVDSYAGGDSLLLTDGKSGRIGVVDATGAMTLTKQIKLADNPKLYSARYDSKSRQVIALTDGKLIKFTLP